MLRVSMLHMEPTECDCESTYATSIDYAAKELPNKVTPKTRYFMSDNQHTHVDDKQNR